MTPNPYAAPASMGDVSPDPFVPVPVTGPWTTWSVVRRTWRTFGRHWIVLSLGVGLISLPIMLRRFGIMWLFSSMGNTPLARVLVFLVPEALTAWLEAGMLLQWMTAFQGGRPRIGQIFVPAAGRWRFVLVWLVFRLTAGAPSLLAIVLGRDPWPKVASLSNALPNAAENVLACYVRAALLVDGAPIGAAFRLGWRTARARPLRVILVGLHDYTLFYIGDLVCGMFGLPFLALSEGTPILLYLQETAPAAAEMSPPSPVGAGV